MRTSTLAAILGSVASAPAPTDRQVIASEDGLGGHSFEFDSSAGFFVVQIVGRNNANSDPGIGVTWNGVSLEEATTAFTATEGTPFCWLGVYAAGVVTGVNTLAVTCTGSAGDALILVTDLSAIDPAWVGSEPSATEADSSSIATPYASASLNPGQVFQQVCWVLPAPEIEQTAASTELWMETAGGTVGAFYVIDNDIAPTDFGWNVDASGLSGPAACLVVEVQGAVI